MALKLPYSRVIKVDVNRRTSFPTRRGFGTQLILTGTAVTGQVDASHRTKLYTTIQEVQADYAANTTVYAAALAAFSRNPRPIRLKIGFIDLTVATNAANMIAQLNLLNDSDAAWYVVTIDKAMRDHARLDGLAQWIEAQEKQAFVDSNDVLTKDPADLLSFAARNKGLYERTSVMWHDNADTYTASSMAAYLSTRNFDDKDSHYTMKFRKAPGIPPVNIGSAALTAITGFVEQIGQNKTEGHCANALVDIGDQTFLVEGSTLTQNTFIDEIHAADWLKARSEEEGLALYLNNARIPFTDQGMEQLASVPRMIMQLGVKAGIVASDFNPSTGEYEEAWNVEVPSIFDVPESQRKARIAPAIVTNFRFAGAVHWSALQFNMSF